MISLVYVSTAIIPFDPLMLTDLLDEARGKNAAANVTGALLYSDGNILQALEGEAETVGPLFLRIQRDPRHHGVIKLYEMPIGQRQFGKWSMALARPEILGEAEGVQSIAVLRKALASPAESEAADDVRTLLEVFADNLR